LQMLLQSSEHGVVDLNGLRADAKRLRSAEPPRAIRGFDEAETRALLNVAAQRLEAAADEYEELQKELERLRVQAGDDTAGKEAIGKALIAATRAGEEIAAEARASAERIKSEAEAEAAAILEQAAKAAEAREHESVVTRARLEAEHAAARAGLEEEHAAKRAELERERERLAQERESLHSVAELERTRALEEAREQADSIVAEARQEADRLRGYAERMRSLLSDSQRSFVEFAESALRGLEDPDSVPAPVQIPVQTGSGKGELLDDLRPSEVEEKPASAPSPLPGD
jgi:cell division septum initiation protein DivIVA